MLNGVSGMVGETAVVTKELAGPHQPGSVLARGEEWFARSMFPGPGSHPVPRWWWRTSSGASWSATPPIRPDGAHHPVHRRALRRAPGA